MATCQTLKELPLVCGSEGSFGGTQKVYMIADKDLGTVTGSTLPYAVSPTTGVITEIALAAPAVGFVQIGQLKNVAGLASELTKNATTGSQYFTSTATMQLQGLTPENYAFIESVRYQPVSFVFQSRSGNYYSVFGLEIATLSTGTGIGQDDLNGMTMTFTGTSAKPELITEQSAVADVINL